jgi:hypothetical protein
MTATAFSCLSVDTVSVFRLGYKWAGISSRLCLSFKHTLINYMTHYIRFELIISVKFPLIIKATSITAVCLF